ncbi:hypothetical protein ACFOWE_11395, partial [Planomonospora corallina]
VGAADLTVDEAAGCVRAGGRTLPEGTLVTVDGTGGRVLAGRPRTVAAPADPHLHRLLGWADEVSGGAPGSGDAERLSAAHAVLRDARRRPGGARPAGDGA